MNTFEGQVAIVTGAGRGIGEAIAKRFVELGARVAVVSRTESNSVKVAESLNAIRPDSAKPYAVDVADFDAVQKAGEQILADFGRCDVLVNNAGITGFEQGVVAHDPENAELEDWRAVHATNLDGTFLGCKHAIRAMRRTGKGSIINISSRSGVVGIPGAAAYASSKAAIRNHTKTVALYCAEQGLEVRCNSIQPAAILTPMWEPLLGEGPDRKARMAAFVADTPLRRFGQPVEVAAIAVLLASDEAPYMTGTEINIDGGILAGSVAVSGSTAGSADLAQTTK